VFLKNKYTNWYNKIVENARLKFYTGYTEKHHIIPKSLGGSNEKGNLVLLSAREHFICHLLLTKMTTGKNKSKMILAVFKLTGKGKRQESSVIGNSKFYEKIKTELSLIVSRQHKGRKRPTRTNEYIAKQRQSHLGKKNHAFKGIWVTPWGKYESTNLAAISCPYKITANYIRMACIKNNKKPINLLSVCRSKGFLNKNQIGKTPQEIGFSFQFCTF
jgi:hypothetical protein